MLKTKDKILVLLFFITLPFCYIKDSYAQTIDTATRFDFGIAGKTTILFSSGANIQLKEAFMTNSFLKADFSNFSGGPLTIVPLSDLIEIGTKQEVRTSSSILIDFMSAPANTNSFGFSIAPLITPAIFSITVTTNPQTSSSSSSSGGIPTSSSGAITTSSGGSSSSGDFSFEKSSVEISGPDIFKLAAKKVNSIQLKVKAINFSLKSKCEIFTTNDPLFIIKPKIFQLGGKKIEQTVRIGIPAGFAKNLIITDTSKDVTINVTCENTATAELGVTIEP